MLLRIVIGEKAFWDKGLGTEATRLVVEEAFEVLGLDEVRLEVFAHNPRAISVYERIGFERTGEHSEWIGPNRPRLHVFEMSLRRPPDTEPEPSPSDKGAASEPEPSSLDEPAIPDHI
jgi:RimJ/RimL family protein N-acetyltransferase